MNIYHRLSQFISVRKTGFGIASAVLAMLFILPLISHGQQRGGQQHSAPAPRAAAPAPRMASPAPRAAAPRPAMVDRSSHGSIRHLDTHVVPRAPEVHREPEHPAEIRHDAAPRHDFFIHHDAEVDFRAHHFWNDFAFGRRLGVLPLGYLALQIGGSPYYYNDGIYYQPSDGGYQEVYPPVGAAIPQPPDGALEIDAGGQAYFYAGGAFYLQQADGSYAIAPTPIGVVVPELPPGAVQVALNGTVAYQFNGVYYEPTFVDGVTQYETVSP